MSPDLFLALNVLVPVPVPVPENLPEFPSVSPHWRMRAARRRPPILGEEGEWEIGHGHGHVYGGYRPFSQVVGAACFSSSVAKRGAAPSTWVWAIPRNFS